MPGYLSAAVGKDIGHGKLNPYKHDALLADEYGFDAAFVAERPAFSPSGGAIPPIS